MSHQKEGYLWECSSHAACIGVSDSMIEPGLKHLPKAPTLHSVLPAPNYRAADGQTQVFRLWTSRYRDEGWKWQENLRCAEGGKAKVVLFQRFAVPFQFTISSWTSFWNWSKKNIIWSEYSQLFFAWAHLTTCDLKSINEAPAVCISITINYPFKVFFVASIFQSKQWRERACYFRSRNFGSCNH